MEDKRLAPARREPGLTDLAKRIGDDMTLLAKNHIELARSELTAGLRHASVTIGGLVLGGMVALLGLALLCFAGAVAAEPLLPALWLRLLLGALLFLAIGAGLVLLVVRRLRRTELALPQTEEEVMETTRALTERGQHG